MATHYTLCAKAIGSRISCIKINSLFNLHDDVKKRRADNIAVNFSITILCKMQHYNLLKLDILVANES